MKRRHGFFADRSGNTTVVFALSALPLMIVAGAAIDYNRINDTRTEVQGALDTAVLAAAAKGTLDQTLAKNYFERNLTGEGVTLESVAFRIEGSGVMVGEARVRLPLGLMSLAGKTDTSIAVATRAQIVNPTKISKVDFQITNAQGAFDKEIYWFTKDEDGKIISEELMLSYDYTYTNRGETKVFTPPVNAVKSATVGNYKSVGQKVVVYEDLSYRGKKVNPKILWSDDPKASGFTRTTGECTDPQGQSQAWEDGGDQNFKDFVFTLKCTTELSGKKQVRLIQ